MSELYRRTLIEAGLDIGDTDGDVSVALEMAHLRDKSRKVIRHKNTQKAIAHKKALAKAKGLDGLWWNHPDDDGVIRFTCGKGKTHSRQVHTNKQQNRWDTVNFSDPHSWIKKCYKSPAVEVTKYFDKIDARAERHDTVPDVEMNFMTDAFFGILDRQMKEAEEKADKTLEEKRAELRAFEENNKDVIDKFKKLVEEVREAEEELYWITY